MKVEGNVKLLVAFAWMMGFREGAEAAGGDVDEAFSTASGVNRLTVAADEILGSLTNSEEAGDG